MTGFLAVFRKEWLEWLRTWRLLIAMILYLIVGLGSPLAARLLPELLTRLPEDQLGGVEQLLLHPPGITDAMAQYHKNFGMLALAALIFTLGSVAGERSRGIAEMTLCKPVTRQAWILAKLAVPAQVHLLGTLVAAAGALLYARILFGELDLRGFALLNGLLLLNLLCWTSVAMLASVLARSTGVAAGLALGLFTLLSALGTVPVLGRYLPSGLMDLASRLVLGRPILDPLGPPLAGLLFVVLMVLLSLRVFREQEL